MSNISKRRREGSRSKIKSMGDHKEFLRRITKTLYYSQLPTLPCLSLPVTEVSCALWSSAQRGRSLRRLHADAAADIARSACVSPCALVLAILYLERLKACNPDYLIAIPPADLFLVSLMVGNKFLQDDGEDDDVICSEWAASGGLELNQLKKLEVEFLDAINWNVFVSHKSFEEGLVWLEREVALKQAQMRGFFTYSDLMVTCDQTLLSELVRGVCGACGAVLGGYLAAALALLASLAWLPAPGWLLSPSLSTQVAAPSVGLALPNVTVDSLLLERLLVDELLIEDKIKCCTKWQKYQDELSSEPRRNWFDTIVTNDWKAFEPWWSRTSVLNWLYQSSLVNPLQRWLERINEYADLTRREWIGSPKQAAHCEEHNRNGPPRCVRQMLNFSKLSALAVTISDR